MKKVLILGAQGFIGKTLVLRLKNEYNIIAFDRNNDLSYVQDTNIHFVAGDFVSRNGFDDLLDGVDKVIHLIATTFPNDDTKNIDTDVIQNVVPTLRLLESMVKCNVKEIIFASSAGTVYGETGDDVNTVSSALHPQCAYGVHKKVIESYLDFYHLRYGINHKIMRITNPYGWGQEINRVQGLIPILVNKMLQNEEIVVFGDGSNMRDYLFITDLADAFYSVLKYVGDEHIFNIGYGKSFSINEVIKSIEYSFGKNFVKINYVEKRFCDVYKSFVDLKTTQEKIGWRPKISLEDGIRMTIDKLKNAEIKG